MEGLFDKLEALADRMPEPETEMPDCERTIICNDARSCGRRNCPAYTVQASTWYRRWRSL